MEDGVDNKESQKGALKTATQGIFSIIRLYVYFLLKYSIIFGLIAIIIIVPYLIFANPFTDFINNLEVTPNLFIFIFVIIIILGMYAIFTGGILLKLKKLAFLKANFYENSVNIEGLMDIFKKYTIRLPYKSITNVKITRNLDDKILKTAKITIEFRKDLGVEGPIQLLGKPVVLDKIDNFEEINQLLTEKINKANEIQKSEEIIPKNSNLEEKDSIFYK